MTALRVENPPIYKNGDKPCRPADAVESQAKQRLVPIDEATRRGDSEVQEFYSGAVVLITGGSGFLGKQLVEKLFRTFDIKKLYLLLRPKKGKSTAQRLSYILHNPVYDTLRETRPWFVDRVEAIEGDITKDRLGLEIETWEQLISEVTIVFHSAATINFADPLKVATNINVKGTMEMLSFGKACQKLRSYVHISTAYSQALNSRVHSDIPEEFSKSPMTPHTLVDLAETLPQDTLDQIFHKYLGNDYPNTYAYTKAVAEEAVRTMSEGLPIAIVRPTVVIPSYTEPAPGWVDKNNVFGASGIILGLGLGVIHTLISDPDIKIDIIPVDIVNNAVIVAGWETARRWGVGEADTRIYTVGSSYRNSITWSFLTETLEVDARNHVSPKAVWYAFAVQSKHIHVYAALAWILHFIPGYIVDGILMLMGRKPRATKIYNQLNTMSKVFSYFTLRSWNFQDDNLLKMYKNLSLTDQQIFNIDIKTVDMTEAILLWHIGLRRFFLKDDFVNDEQAQKKQVMLKYVTFVIAPIYFYVFYKIFVCLFYFLYSFFLL
ncbi:fatty acyl-CoA reductase wat [Amyelois transitella]|uniref:fatty acyl-CoA reductase wat n=1 Tax=Amyelois transitella TaxID=680683 RepID=UPI0029905006|nr:fatty acyl-CoA reductase wat [Amyelois transitella]